MWDTNGIIPHIHQKCTIILGNNNKKTLTFIGLWNVLHRTNIEDHDSFIASSLPILHERFNFCTVCAVCVCVCLLSNPLQLFLSQWVVSFQAIFSFVHRTTDVLLFHMRPMLETENKLSKRRCRRKKIQKKTKLKRFKVWYRICCHYLRDVCVHGMSAKQFLPHF